jgi:hypothetical protein
MIQIMKWPALISFPTRKIFRCHLTSKIEGTRKEKLGWERLNGLQTPKIHSLTI